jgi:hypothetical protein
MEQDRMNEIAEQLDAKAESVADGFYGKDDDDESWAADLRRAAKRLRRGAEGVQELNATDFQEIESGSDIDGDELAALRKEAQEANEV